MCTFTTVCKPQINCAGKTIHMHQKCHTVQLVTMMKQTSQYIGVTFTTDSVDNRIGMQTCIQPTYRYVARVSTDHIQHINIMLSRLHTMDDSTQVGAAYKPKEVRDYKQSSHVAKLNPQKNEAISKTH